MTHLIIPALVALLVSGPVWAKTDVDIFSGNYWYKICSSTKGEDALSCLGYIIGLVESQDILETMYMKIDGVFHKSASYCVPDGVSMGQRRDVFVKYLRDHPEKRHERAMVLFANATREAFCK